MYISKQIIVKDTNNNSVIASVHRIDNVTITTTIAVNMSCYINDSETIPLQSITYIMPWQFSNDPDLRKSATAWLISQSGPLVGGEVINADDQLDVLKTDLNNKINVLRDQYIAGGCTTPYGKVNTDDASLRNIMGAAQIAFMATASNQSYSMSWRLYDNSNVNLTATQVINMAEIVMGYVQYCYTASWTLKAEVTALTTADDVTSFNYVQDFITLLTNLINPPASNPTSGTGSETDISGSSGGSTTETGSDGDTSGTDSGSTDSGSSTTPSS